MIFPLSRPSRLILGVLGLFKLLFGARFLNWEVFFKDWKSLLSSTWLEYEFSCAKKNISIRLSTLVSKFLFNKWWYLGILYIFVTNEGSLVAVTSLSGCTKNFTILDLCWNVGTIEASLILKEHMIFMLTKAKLIWGAMFFVMIFTYLS